MPPRHPALPGPAWRRPAAHRPARVPAPGRRLRPPAGFTLVEVMVALVVMALVAAMGWQGVSGMVRAREIGQEASHRTLRLSAVIAQWEQDIAAVYDSPVVPGISFDGSALRLVRRQGPGVQVVVWSLRGSTWQRWPGPVVQRGGALRESWLVSQQLQGQDPAELKLLDGVREWQVYFWRGSGWTNAQSSGDVQQLPDPNAQMTVPPPSGGASAPGGGASAPQPGASAPAVPRTRSLLPTGVRLQIDLPEGRLLRDVMLAPTA